MTPTVAVTYDTPVTYEAPVTYQTPGAGPGLELSSSPNPWIVWAVLVIIWASALFYAWLCHHQGGWPSINWAWGGFRIACNR